MAVSFRADQQNELATTTATAVAHTIAEKHRERDEMLQSKEDELFEQQQEWEQILEDKEAQWQKELEASNLELEKTATGSQAKLDAQALQLEQAQQLAVKISAKNCLYLEQLQLSMKENENLKQKLAKTEQKLKQQVEFQTDTEQKLRNALAQMDRMRAKFETQQQIQALKVELENQRGNVE
jgi:hypothetical protein